MYELYYSYPKVGSDKKIIWLIFYSYVLFEEVSPCLLEDVYEIFIFYFWFPQRVRQHNSVSFNRDTEQDPVKPIDTRTHT